MLTVSFLGFQTLFLRAISACYCLIKDYVTCTGAFEGSADQDQVVQNLFPRVDGSHSHSCHSSLTAAAVHVLVMVMWESSQCLGKNTVGSTA